MEDSSIPERSILCNIKMNNIDGNIKGTACLSALFICRFCVCMNLGLFQFLGGYLIV